MQQKGSCTSSCRKLTTLTRSALPCTLSSFSCITHIHTQIWLPHCSHCNSTRSPAFFKMAVALCGLCDECHLLCRYDCFQDYFASKLNSSSTAKLQESTRKLHCEHAFRMVHLTPVDSLQIHSLASESTHLLSLQACHSPGYQAGESAAGHERGAQDCRLWLVSACPQQPQEDPVWHP